MAKPKQSPDTSTDDKKSDEEVRKQESNENAGPSNTAPSSPPASETSVAGTEADDEDEVRKPSAQDFKAVAHKMETAPRDGSRILALADDDEPVVIRFNERLNAYVDRHDFTVMPQCWAPLW